MGSARDRHRTSSAGSAPDGSNRQGARPPDFDWVMARHACSLGAWLERLYAGARRNVETRMALRHELRDTGPIECTDVPGGFAVSRWLSETDTHVVVRVRIDGQCLRVEGSGIDVQFAGTLTLTDAGTCRLLVDGEALDEWHVLRRAFERLFFDL